MCSFVRHFLASEDVNKIHFNYLAPTHIPSTHLDVVVLEKVYIYIYIFLFAVAVVGSICAEQSKGLVR